MQLKFDKIIFGAIIPICLLARCNVQFNMTIGDIGLLFQWYGVSAKLFSNYLLQMVVLICELECFNIYNAYGIGTAEY